MNAEKSAINVFQKYLTVWVLLCMVAGVLLGQLFPALPAFLGRFEYANVSLPMAVAIALFGMTSPAALATTVGVLTEVPVMLFLVHIANKTRGRFPS